ncbi:MAG TPA: hypothetical protein VEL76_26515 [Gemmataceae bacterium]|nr:hypothetical protein [Gemmataceae bacterium]
MRSLRFSAEPESVRLPQPPAPGITPGGFLIAPTAAIPGHCQEQWLWQQWVYQRAFELAQAVVRPSLLERDLLGVWN